MSSTTFTLKRIPFTFWCWIKIFFFLYFYIGSNSCANTKRWSNSRSTYTCITKKSSWIFEEGNTRLGIWNETITRLPWYTHSNATQVILYTVNLIDTIGTHSHIWIPCVFFFLVVVHKVNNMHHFVIMKVKV